MGFKETLSQASNDEPKLPGGGFFVLIFLTILSGLLAILFISTL